MQSKLTKKNLEMHTKLGKTNKVKNNPPNIKSKRKIYI